jgi:hypothetical protein
MVVVIALVLVLLVEDTGTMDRTTTEDHLLATTVVGVITMTMVVVDHGKVAMAAVDMMTVVDLPRTDVVVLLRADTTMIVDMIVVKKEKKILM